MHTYVHRSGHFTFVRTVASQLRGTAVCHNCNYVCWKDLTEDEVCLVPLMTLKLCTLPLLSSFKQTWWQFLNTFQTLHPSFIVWTMQMSTPVVGSLKLTDCWEDNEMHSIHKNCTSENGCQTSRRHFKVCQSKVCTKLPLQVWANKDTYYLICVSKYGDCICSSSIVHYTCIFFCLQ